MAGDAPGVMSLQLLGSWRLNVDDSAVAFPYRLQRVVAALALLGRRPRRHLAELLWPGFPQGNATSNLRVSIWDIRHRIPHLVAGEQDALRLSPRLTIDVATLPAAFVGITTISDISRLTDALRLAEGAELLPGWDESWLEFDQDLVKQVRVKALEALAARFLHLGEPDLAFEAATWAVAAEPLRESAYELLMQTHVVARNTALALRVYEGARTTLRRELGIEPGPDLASLATSLRRTLQTADR